MSHLQILRRCGPSSSLLLLTLFLFLSACSSSDTPNTPPTAEDFAAVVALGGDPDEPVARDEIVSEESFDDVVEGQIFRCTRKSKSLVRVPEDYALFDPNKEVIWPGSLLQGNSLGQSTPNGIPIGNRGPGVIFIGNLNGTESSLRAEIPVLGAAAVNDHANGIIRGLAGQPLAARFTYNATRVHTEEQMSVELGIGFDNWFADARTNLAFSQEFEYNRFIVKLQQVFYTISLDTGYGTRLGEVFDATVTASELGRFVQAGNPPCFVSSVSYGRTFYYLIESTSSVSEMSASIEASITTAAANGELEAGTTYVSQLENKRISAYAVGGDSQLALGVVTGGFDSLRDFLNDGGDIRTGEPLSYVVKSLAHPDQTVKMGLALDYDEVNCEMLPEIINPLFHYTSADHGIVEEWLGNGHSYVKRLKNQFNGFETSLGDALAIGGEFGCLRYTQYVSGHPSLVLKAPTTVDGRTVGKGFSFAGSSLAESDFTIIAVVRAPGGASDERFIWGNNYNAPAGISLGINTEYSDQYIWTSTGFNNNLAAQATEDITAGFQVYTYRFSQTEGLQIYLNNVLLDSATGATAPAASFTGATFGSLFGRPIYVPEIKGYGAALSTERREEIVDAFLLKYRI